METGMKPQRYDEHRGRRGDVSARESRPPMTQRQTRRRRLVPSHSPAPNSPAQLGRTHEPLHPALHAERRLFERMVSPSAPFPSAFLPFSAVFHCAPLRSERFLKTPQRSEGTQSGKWRRRAHRVLTSKEAGVLHPSLPPDARRVGFGSAALCSSCRCGQNSPSPLPATR